jgi:hypothetical protein
MDTPLTLYFIYIPMYSVCISIHRPNHRGRKMSMQMLIVPDSYKNYQKWICDISVTEGVYGGTLYTPLSNNISTLTGQPLKYLTEKYGITCTSLWLGSYVISPTCKFGKAHVTGVHIHLRSS